MTYNYDPVGNRDSTVNGGTVEYAHNELNEYTSVDWTTFTSDLRGNLVNDGNQGYQYDLENRLTAVNENISYAYNPFGLRISKTVDGETTSYVLDNNRVIGEWEDGELQRKFIYGVGIDELLVMETGGERYYYNFDPLGSVINLSNSSGSTVATYCYNIYGAFQPSGSFLESPYTFTGRRFDLESGLYYYRARYYNPGMGRLLQVDPIGYANGTNLYTYVTNNPVKYVDPYGLIAAENECCKNSREQCQQDADGWLESCQSAALELYEEFQTMIDMMYEDCKTDCEAKTPAWRKWLCTADCVVVKEIEGGFAYTTYKIQIGACWSSYGAWEAYCLLLPKCEE
jgi:RHS repeat-associated protein